MSLPGLGEGEDRVLSALFCLIILTYVASTDGTNSVRKVEKASSCSAVKVVWGAKGLGSQVIPTSTISGDHLRLCSQGPTCCTKAMEDRLLILGRKDFSRMSIERMASIQHDFMEKLTKFEEFCLTLIDNSTKDLHDMFQKTYGLLYLQNSQIFADLFRDLRAYFRGKDLDLLDVLEKFFSILFQRMFALLNTSYEFDEHYLSCVAENIEKLKPFGDVPQKLSVHVRRAFVAARTFLQGLRIGKNVISGVSKVEPTESCSQAITRMLYCPYCKGLIAIKPCLDYCSNVMKGCFHFQTELGDIWEEYVEAMLKVADRLEGPFNIESVVEPLDVKISDAIMNFQENSEAVTSLVFQECGQPTLGSRRKRQSGGAARSNQKSMLPTAQSASALDRTMPEIRDVLLSSKDFWKQMSLSACGAVSAPLSHENNCWNGKSKARYMLEIVDDGTNSTATNPEVAIDEEERNTIVDQKSLLLKLITNRLHNAYSGLNVDWMETDDENEDEDSASGGNMFPLTAPPPPPPLHRHRHNLFPNTITVSTFRPYDAFPPKSVVKLEKNHVPSSGAESSLNISRKLLWLTHFLIFSFLMNHSNYL